MRPAIVDIYQIDRNSFGELLVAMPDLGEEDDTASFEMHRDDLIVYYGNGDVVRLPTVPAAMTQALRTATALTIVEVDDEKLPVRCYACEVSLS